MATTPLTRIDGDAHHNVTIKVEDVAIVFSNLLLNERLADTNHFSFTWKNEINDSFTDNQEEFIEQYFGKNVVITFDEQYTFKGIILEISFFKNDGLTQEFTVSGQSPAVLLNDKPQSASYYKKTPKDIIADSIKGVPVNLLSFDNNPSITSELFYIVQYNETDFNFIKNLAVRTGEWFFYNGEKLRYGPLANDTINVRVGTELFDAKMAYSIKPFQNSAVAYDGYLGEIITSGGNKPATTGILDILLKASGQTFSRTSPKPTHKVGAPTASILEAQLDTDAEGRIARMSTFSAKSYNAKIKLGTKIKVQDGNKNIEYIVIQIQHSVPTRDSYTNSFVAVPSTIKVPPYTNRSWFPVCETQSAMVKENEDKDVLDRLRVHFPWQSKNEMTPWIKIQSPYAGEGKGFRFVPEKMEEVMIGFEGGNAERPYVIGAMYNGAAKSAHSHEGNHIKIFRTASGCRLMMNDKDGSVKLVDKAGSFIKMDGSGNISISAGGNLKIQIGGNSEIEISGDSKNTIGKKLEESIGADKKTEVSMNESKTIGQDFSIAAGMNHTTQAGQNIETTAGMEMSQTAGMKIAATAGTEFGIEAGAMVKIKGGATAEIASPMTTVKGDAMTVIKGGMVMIN
ncbi:MAG: hypothetical protein IPG85_13765 [Bacteroidetes bacterium]|nr:hypothetical protein [Bacteroidota bacterium]